MIDAKFAESFANHWLQAWNAHDLDQVLSHYANDFEMSSPFILQMGQSPTGTLCGKEAVRAYWTHALQSYPDVHFELVSVLAGVDSVVICYRMSLGKLAAEWFGFGPDGLVRRSAAHYGL